jgi:hypothetical protein
MLIVALEENLSEEIDREHMPVNLDSEATYKK